MWLLSLSIVCSRFTHIVAHITTSFFFIGFYSILWSICLLFTKYHTVLIIEAKSWNRVVLVFHRCSSFPNYFAYFRSFEFPYTFLISLFISAKKPAGMVIRIMLNWHLHNNESANLWTGYLFLSLIYFSNMFLFWCTSLVLIFFERFIYLRGEGPMERERET